MPERPSLPHLLRLLRNARTMASVPTISPTIFFSRPVREFGLDQVRDDSCPY
ncbi:hypothetical protein Scep_012312 [Stephania cephalantha]|uniref:Uncharacterized protein n=1 Tax=Stephania cephalantha TaxID=152367 RepID=A0AAP0JEX7_9MAGN